MEAECNFLAKALLDGIAGAVAGGVLGAFITVGIDGRRKRREVSMRILERMVSLTRDIAEVEYLFEHPADLKDERFYNQVIALGNWFEVVAGLAATKTADAAMLEAGGMKKEMLDFLKATKTADEEVNVGLVKVIGDDWKQLISFTDFSWNEKKA
jgi:hypothetical protein